MSNVLITKFPVTAADGTEYRVKIEEVPSSYCCVAYASVMLYVKRKRFGFRRIYRRTYDNGGGVYDHKDPDYVALSERAVRDYYEDVQEEERYLRIVRAERLRRQTAVDRFNAWDGKISADV